MSAEGGNKAVVAALLANLGIAVTKFVAFALTGFSSMLAEAIHSVADSFNQLLLLLGGKRARRAATPEHPFGFGRERYVYAFVVSIVLFSLGGLFALYEAYHKWHEAHAGESGDPFASRWWWVPIAVLVISIGLEGMSFRTAFREGSKAKGRSGWVGYIRGAKAPELPVILLEDFAALIGLTFALVGVGLTLLTGEAYWDAVGTGLIGVLLVTVAITLAVEMKSLLIGEAASPLISGPSRPPSSSRRPSTGSSTSRPSTSGPMSCSSGRRSPSGRPTRRRTSRRPSTRRSGAPVPPSPASPSCMYLEPDIDRGAARADDAEGSTGQGHGTPVG